MAGRVAAVGGDLETIGAAEARSALLWWLEAGVDIAVQDQPRDWLAPAPARAEPLVAEPRTNLVQPAQETLAELQSWLATAVQLPFAGPTAKRILPHGPEDAAVMLL